MQRIIMLATIALFLVVNHALASQPISFTGVITSNAVLDVPADFSDINSAMDYLADKSIKAGVTVTIQVADGTYIYTDYILIDHPDGNRINIIGNSTNPSSCVLQFNGVNGICVYNGNSLGFVDGIRIISDGTIDQIGLHIDGHSYVQAGDNLLIDNFDHAGIRVGIGSTFYGGSISINNCNNYGVRLFASSFRVNGATISNNDKGVFSEFNSTASLNNSTIINNTTYGFLCNSSGNISAFGTSVIGNGTDFYPAANTSGFQGCYIAWTP